MELSMDISANSYRSANRLDVGLLRKDFFGLLMKVRIGGEKRYEKSKRNRQLE